MKIKCPACAFENREGAKFCSNCAEPLVLPKTSINKETLNNTENTNIKRIIKKERLRMNKKQRVILALFVPVLLFFITLTIAYYVSVEVVITPGYTTSVPTPPGTDPESALAKIIKLQEGREDWQPGDPLYTHHPAITNKYYNPYDWQRTWYVWLLFLAFCCFFEYKLFEDKEIISNKKSKE